MQPSEPLPDRRIYHSASPLVYIAALLVHAADECRRFWQTDWRALSLGIVLPSLGLWFSYFTRGKVATVSDAHGILLTTALPPLAVAVTLFLWGVAKAPYQIHKRTRELLAAATAAQADAAIGIADSRTLTDRLRLLSQEIQQFVAEREAMPVDVDDARIAGWKFGFREYMNGIGVSLHKNHSETRELYTQKFANRVIAAREEIRRALPQVEIGEYQHPWIAADMRDVAKWLGDTANLLP
ncbi:MAG TPA: hypothetical protein VNQ74_00180 [Burkholderiaceae bacterium]|nr:hypothetical protein [Burkholderiaceae bacterium]